MNRIDTQTLATHLEVALTFAPPETLDNLKDTDGLRRRRATFNLAQHLADRLRCFEVSSKELGCDADRQRLLFQDASNGN